MIMIWYAYERKDGSKAEGEAVFEDPLKAVRFIRSIRGKGHILLGYSCCDPEDNEYIARRI